MGPPSRRGKATPASLRTGGKAGPRSRRGANSEKTPASGAGRGPRSIRKANLRQRQLELARKVLGGVQIRELRTRTMPAPSPRRSPVEGHDTLPPATLRSGLEGAPAPVGNPHGSIVLVIDDEPVVLDLIVQVLATEHLVYRANGSERALRLLKRIPPVDVIICDVMMPEVDGYAFAKIIKADPTLRTIPLLFLTARDSAKDRIQSVQAGARSYITKPFKVRALLSAVARASRRTFPAR